VDEAGAFLSANTAMARIFGIPAAGIAGRRLPISYPGRRRAMLGWVHNTVHSRKSSEIQSVMRIKDRVFWFSTHFVPIFGRTAAPWSRCWSMARDITDRQQMENQMARRRKLASWAPWRRAWPTRSTTPWGVMLGFTELLLDKLPPDSKKHEMLKTIERQGLNAKRIVGKSHDFCPPAGHA